MCVCTCVRTSRLDSAKQRKEKITRARPVGRSMMRRGMGRPRTNAKICTAASPKMSHHSRHMEDLPIGVYDEGEVGGEMGKGSRPPPTWSAGGTRVTVTTQGGVVMAKTSGDYARREKRRHMLLTQLRCTQQRDTVDPRRCISRDPGAVCLEFAKTTEQLMEMHPTGERRQEIVYEQGTWQLISSLLSNEMSAREGMLHWVQSVSRRCVLDVLRNGDAFVAEERFLVVLGWLVAANLDLDAARLAISEGEVDLGQLLMCRHDPELTKRLLKSYTENDPMKNKRTLHPRLRSILDLLSGESDALLNELNVDWRIRLGSVLRLMDSEEVPLYNTLQCVGDAFPMEELENDLHFQLLTMFAKLHEGQTVDSDHLSRILALDVLSETERDPCLKWQLFIILAAANLVHEGNICSDAVCQLYQAMCDECEAFGLPEWSVFVCLHQQLCPAALETQLDRILGRTVVSWIHNTASESFLTDELRIPSEWILRTKACWYKRSHLSQLELDCMVAIGEFDVAHRILCQKVIPSMLEHQSINNCSLVAILTMLEEKGIFQHQDQIHNWELGCGLLLSIQKLLTMQASSPQELLSAFLKDMHRAEHAIEESKKLWSRISDTENDVRKIQRMHETLFYCLERHYCQLYASVHGNKHILTRILEAKCHNKEQQLLLW